MRTNVASERFDVLQQKNNGRQSTFEVEFACGPFRRPLEWRNYCLNQRSVRQSISIGHLGFSVCATNPT